jgi:hypothetical protein
VTAFWEWMLAAGAAVVVVVTLVWFHKVTR